MRRLFLIGVGAVLISSAGYVLYRNVYQSEPVAEFAGVSLRLEFATSTEARERGLGGRVALAPNEAMLFAFTESDRYGFWMKDTLIPLDIFWLDDKGQVIYFEPDVATSTYPRVFYPSAPARYVLETAAGFARAHGVTVGTSLRLQNFPSVSE